jgi:hypothetical protein
MQSRHDGGAGRAHTAGMGLTSARRHDTAHDLVRTFTGSLIGDLWAGRPLFPSFEAGWEAAVGRFWGTVSKLAIGAILVVILALAAFF